MLHCIMHEKRKLMFIRRMPVCIKCVQTLNKHRHMLNPLYMLKIYPEHMIVHSFNDYLIASTLVDLVVDLVEEFN